MTELDEESIIVLKHRIARFCAFSLFESDLLDRFVGFVRRFDR